MEKHCQNALHLAQFLGQQSWINTVHYLGLPSHKHHCIAKKQQQGFGALVSFDVGSQEKAFQIRLMKSYH